MPTVSLPRRLSGWILPVIALGLFAFAVYAVITPGRTRADPPVQPPTPPTATAAATIAGIGTVEPQSELIRIASELPGVIRDVYVRPGDSVTKGAPLFRLDTRDADAAVAAARADVQSAATAIAAAEVAVADERQRLALFQAVDDPRALSKDEIARRRFAVDRAEAALAQARAARAVAESRLAERLTDRERLTVRAPMTGRIYSVDARPGEFASDKQAETPLMTFGVARPLHVRVEIDEADAPRLQESAAAFGTLRGRPDVRIPLSYVRTEPEVREKRALSGGAERVDTRVIEVLYAFDPDAHPTWLGQRMDVFIAAPRTTSSPRLMADAVVRK